MLLGNREVTEVPCPLSLLKEGERFVYIPAGFSNIWEVYERQNEKVTVKMFKPPSDKEVYFTDTADANVFKLEGEV